MKISEVVHQLETIKRERGDIDVECESALLDLVPVSITVVEGGTSV